LTLIDGTVTTVNGSDIDLFNIVKNTIFGCWINTANMVATDEFTIKVYVRDASAGSTELFSSETLTDVQAEPMFFIPFLPNYLFRVSITRISGTNRSFDWIRFEQ